MISFAHAAILPSLATHPSRSVPVKGTFPYALSSWLMNILKPHSRRHPRCLNDLLSSYLPLHSLFCNLNQSSPVEDWLLPMGPFACNAPPPWLHGTTGSNTI